MLLKMFYLKKILPLKILKQPLKEDAAKIQTANVRPDQKVLLVHVVHRALRGLLDLQERQVLPDQEVLKVHKAQVEMVAQPVLPE
jgi:hypothetical protein